ncbi:phage tail tape measure protein [Acinetobacter junii]|uniref:phage tail tape measure protein n=1 Tax=Acinetobacter junii TaxID=40215 RepID=UPI0019020346|nr:phage tail tape measure protein [Acinetobacter junii]MBJ8440019.1 phage tail tape measure protein [Acinetobacter junii]
MSVKLGTLTLDLVTKIGNFIGPINEAESKLTKSFSKMRDSVNSFGLIAVSAGAGATAAIIAMADNMAKHNAELERFAYLAQTSVAEFQKMSVGAKMMGIEADKLSDIMKDWNERFGDFLTAGSGPLVDFMEQVAVKTEKGADGAMKLAKELSKLSGPESMGLFVKKMEEANLSQDQMSFLMESMASDATLLLPLLKNNAEGMRLWGEAAERAGIIMDEKTLKASRELQVQTQMLDMQYEGLKKQLLSAVIPALVDVSEAMVDGDTSARGMADAGDVLATSLRGVAAIGIGVYATLNLIAVAMAGVTKSAVDSYNITQKASEQGSWFDKLPGIKLLKGGLTFGVTASAENSGIGMAVEDSKSILEDSANKLEKIFDSATSTATAKLAALQGQVNQTNTAATQGAKDWLDKQNKVTEATKAATQAQAELNRKLEEQARLQESLIYEFSTDLQKMQIEYSRKVKDINAAGFSPEMQAQYLAAAKARLQDEQTLFKMQQAYELSEFKLNEEAKARARYLVDQQIIANRTDIATKDKELYLSSLKEKHTQELAWLELEKRQRISDASEAFRTDMENIAARYEFERKQILLNKSISDDERKALLNASVYTQNKDESQVRDGAIADYRDVMGFEESPLVRQFEVLQKMRELDLINEEAYQKSKLDLTLKYGASYMESMLGGFASLVDENSKTYAVLFAAQKEFAVAQAMLNIPQAYSKAYDAVVGTPYVGPYIAPAIGAAAAALQVAQAAKINSVNYSGFANGGYTGAGGKYDPAGIVHKGEVVFSQADVARWGGVGNVEALRTGKGFADGGIVDTKVLDMSNNQAISGYLSDRQTANEQASSQQSKPLNMSVNNFVDWDSGVPEAMATPAGTKVFMNMIKREKTKINALLGRA